MQRDPQAGRLSVPASVVNGYAYVANNPSNLTDPSGQSFLGDMFNVFLDVQSYIFAGLGALAMDLAGLGDLKRSLTFAVIFAAATVGTGGALGAAMAGAGYGVLASTVGGALAGGLMGGGLNVASGRGSFWAGFAAGALSGGMAAYSAASAVNGVKPAGVDRVRLASNDVETACEQAWKRVRLNPGSLDNW